MEVLQNEKVDVVISDLHLPPHVDDISEGLTVVQAAQHAAGSSGRGNYRERLKAGGAGSR